MTDNINPEHYVLANGHQVIEVSENLTSNGGQAVQYIARATRTDGVTKNDPVEDLKKAIWFIEREIGRITPADTLRSWTLTDLAKLREGYWDNRVREWEVVIGDDNPKIGYSDALNEMLNKIWNDPPAVHRVWNDLAMIPPNVIVEDGDGDQYMRVGDTDQFKVRYVDDATKVEYAHWKPVEPWLWKDQGIYAPFTEVLDG